MRVPGFDAELTLSAAGLWPIRTSSVISRAMRVLPSARKVEDGPDDDSNSGGGSGGPHCDALDWIYCAGAVALCFASCSLGAEACALCFLGVGAPTCKDCVSSLGQ
jgi:hypothetical protein